MSEIFIEVKPLTSLDEYGGKKVDGRTWHGKDVIERAKKMGFEKNMEWCCLSPKMYQLRFKDIHELGKLYFN